jgi:hypothetical protein
MARSPVDYDGQLSSKHGDATPGSRYGKHLGDDYPVKKAPVKAVERVQVVSITRGPSMGLTLETRDSKGFLHRDGHLDGVKCLVGNWYNEGEVLATSGNSGQTTGKNGGWHLHHDIRLPGTKWTDGFDKFLSFATWLNRMSPQATTASATSAPAAVSIRMNGGPQQHWNVRTSPDMGNNVRKDGHAIGGQQYGAEMHGPWAKINFMGKPGFVGPKAFTKI